MISATTAAAKSNRILLIEDEPAVAAFLRRALEQRGYEVVASASAADALPMLALGNFRGVISDFRTPGGITGADVHDWLLRHRPELASHIVFITGDLANKETTELLEQSGTPFIEKPFRVHQLIAAVEETIGRP
jgi:DNA-binding NtrC family response regulator